jgi:hypothetical protein
MADNTNYGLLTNMAQGIREGLIQYQAAKNNNRQNMNKGLIPKKDADGNIIGFDKDPTYKKPGSALAEAVALLGMQNTKSTIEERDRKAVDDAEKKASPAHQFTLLPKETQIQIEDLAKKIGGRTSIGSSLQAGLDKINDPSLSQEQKLITGKQMIKTLNSTEGQDAVGAEESKRLASLLEYHFFNFTEPGPAFGRAPIESFGEQVKNKISELASSKKALQGETADLYKGAGREDLARGGLIEKSTAPPPAASPKIPSSIMSSPNANAAKPPAPPPGKIHVSNGKEDFFIDPAKLPSAMRDGYQEIK